jgi:hypothetical protein
LSQQNTLNKCNVKNEILLQIADLSFWFSILPGITRDARDESVFSGDEIDVAQRRKFLPQFFNHFGDRFCCQSFESLVGLK